MGNARRQVSRIKTSVWFRYGNSKPFKGRHLRWKRRFLGDSDARPAHSVSKNVLSFEEVIPRGCSYGCWRVSVVYLPP